MPPLNLSDHVSGDTDYITLLNNHKDQLQAAVNLLSADVAGLVSTTTGAASLDFRRNAINLIINGGFDYWQRGTTDIAPDAWTIRNADIDYQVDRVSTPVQLNTYSVRATGQGQITQDLEEEIRQSLDTTIQMSFGCYVRTNTESHARIGIDNGVGTTWSNSNHPGDDSWQFMRVPFTQGSGDRPTVLRFILDSQVDDEDAIAYFNSAVLIRGNPEGGPIFIQNDPTYELLRVLSLYETGSLNVRGVGYLNGSDREIEVFVPFCSPKRTEDPSNEIAVLLSWEEETGYELEVGDITNCGFQLIARELGGFSGSDGFLIEDITWTAEV